VTTVEYLLYCILAKQIVNALFDTRRDRKLLEYLFDIRDALQKGTSQENDSLENDSLEKYEERQREFKLRYPKLVEEMGKAVAETAQHLRETGGKVIR
jgi:hypothetical protein